MLEKIDPVCGMVVNGDTLLRSSFKGSHYFFCSEKCRADFEKDPATVLMMKAAREKAAEKERSRSVRNVLDEVAHEVRNPLTVIGGFARKVFRKMPRSDPNREYMELIIEGVERLEHSIGNLIKLTTTGESRPEAVNINSIVQESVKLFKKELGNKQVEVKLELMDRPPILKLEKNRIMTAVLNLIRNANEAIVRPPGTLKISTRQEDGDLRIAVSDTGEGIPEERLQYIFDPLYTSRAHGSGLGLSFVKRIAEDHGGTVSAESTPGQGTTVTISLPLKGSASQTSSHA